MGALACPHPCPRAMATTPLPVPACVWVDPTTEKQPKVGAAPGDGGRGWGQGPGPSACSSGPAESPGLDSGVRSEVPGAALFLGVNTTAMSWGQKALLLRRGLDCAGEGAFSTPEWAGAGHAEQCPGFPEPSPPALDRQAVGPLQEVMRAAPGSRLGQGRSPRAKQQGRGLGACRVLAPLSSSGPWRPRLPLLREELSGSLCLCFLWRLPQAQPWP